MSIELIVLDIDGTMTNGHITYSEHGDEIKEFNVKDGLAIVSWIRLGKKAAIITGRSSKIVERRAKELRIDHLYQGVDDKLTKLKELTMELGITMDQVATIGDDLNDYHMIDAVRNSFAPSDASHYITRIASTVLNHKGGDGAVREMIENLIVQEGLEEKFLALWV
jgi:3-deoxy-D-manno-octulosonate 8-phosphate phosphatase (KDO 8-P phosphatase)